MNIQGQLAANMQPIQGGYPFHFGGQGAQFLRLRFDRNRTA